MIRKYAVVAVLAAGSLFVVPAVGQAETPVTTTPGPAPDRPFLSTSPSRLVVGEQALISIGCPADKVHDVQSKVLDLGRFETTEVGPPAIQGAVATIHKDVKPGFYSVTGYCDKVKLTANFELHAPKPTPTPTPTKTTPARPKPTTPQVSKVPTGAPETGGGATANF